MRRILTAALLALSSPALAHDGVHVNAAYAVVASDKATTAAVFMAITNHAAAEDVLVSATSPAASRIEFHTHVEDESGMMMMQEVPEGFAIAAETTRALERAGDHIMLIGLTEPLAPGDEITLELTFARGETIEVTVPVQEAGAMAPMAGHDH